MTRSHRRIVVITAASWVVAVGVMFAPLVAPAGSRESTVLALLAVNAGALAACLTTVSVLPFLLRDFYATNVTDYVGSFLAGWAAAQEPGPRHLKVVND